MRANQVDPSSLAIGEFSIDRRGSNDEVGQRRRLLALADRVKPRFDGLVRLVVLVPVVRGDEREREAGLGVGVDQQDLLAVPSQFAGEMSRSEGFGGLPKNVGLWQVAQWQIHDKLAQTR